MTDAGELRAAAATSGRLATAADGPPQPGTGFRSGFVTLVGRPNSGKSSLVNALLGQKLAIVSDTPQTTRHRFRAILDSADYQMVIVDTPGIHKPHDALGEELNKSAIKALEAVDVAVFVLDAAKPFGRGDEWVLEHLRKLSQPRLLVLSKTDLADNAVCAEQVAAAQAFLDFDGIYPLSSLAGRGLQEFVDGCVARLPAGPRWFPEGTQTDQDLSVLVAEFIREKILFVTSQEVPHAVGVVTENLEYDRKRGLTSIQAFIYVESKSQIGIIIGKGGERIKTIGTQARHDLEQLLGTKVFLDLRVKLRKGWRRDINQIKRFGYRVGD
ncbi:MAG: GTPase Era [Actinomycetia bacterium]|nr:GTPase Era [Actinomycetes bacterium]